MAYPSKTTVSPFEGSPSGFFISWRKIFDAFIAARQRQADARIALYLGSLPADLVKRLRLSAE